ncbi:MAG: D-glycero-beta-D-manno-heptose 1-phosphate adenylyltransferase [Magnetococcales bacterium]|mgnify:CR=1 FL=1|nr:D-glycero-beta-D-manno-heptose 1-phosphate adenylyltransferase [Magnetococcales bacterium]MEC8066648.1 D-glycero-beta-D-manno-heptose 1-phosphate adenylyltransferase [Pseudomonadota bacterium]|tara:strand:- start:68774 stop:69310 length:537 start_codon:yes stop_codon:yes gene_type:complete
MTENSKSRIKTNEELAQIVASARAAGKKVAFTNGVFDFVHVGHVTYLEKARELGDMLIMAINSDASVKRIKGPTRPINAENDRAQILTALRCVDYVTVFEQDTPTEIIDILKPSIHVKGGDYDPEKMPETPTVRKHGGEVVIIPLEEGYSNSKQFDKIKSPESDEKFERPEWLAGSQK